MGISFDWLAKAVESITAEARAALKDRGTLDPDQVLVEFHTQEDDRVRPTHAALDGTTWAPGDPDAPVPPLDYGCRCYVTYKAKPETTAANFLPVTGVSAVRVGVAYARYLDENLAGWRPFLRALHDKHLAKLDQMSECVLWAQKKRPEMSMADVREYARLLIQADKNG
jgi:hypothetical protein